MTTRPLHMDYVLPGTIDLGPFMFHVTATEGIIIPPNAMPSLDQTVICAIAEALGRANKASPHIKSLGHREYRITLMREEHDERWPLGAKSVIGWAIVRERG